MSLEKVVEETAFNLLRLAVTDLPADVKEALRRALLRPLGERNPDPRLVELEEELCGLINMTGIGPMGLGGSTTALGVRVGWAHCHTASLPVGVVFQCWAARRARAKRYRDGRVEYLSHRSG